MKRADLKLVSYSFAIVFLLLFIAAVLAGRHSLAGWPLTLFFIALAMAFRNNNLLKGFSFTVVIFAAVSFAMYYPAHFVQLGNFKLSKLIIPLLQFIMFGMGSELSLTELITVAKKPKTILIGTICHYAIMPLVGFTLVSLFNFPKEIAAGIILIGCCPSGLASNVMAYLARANLALSVAITTLSTLLSPLLTPLLMQLLAGRYVTVHFWDMAWDTTKVVIIPIVAGLLFHFLVKGKIKWIDKILPAISMVGIALILMVITAAGRESLIKVGALLVLAVLIHNLAGYTLGYWISRLLGVKEKDCRTISLEVGMQNAGLASGLALLMGGMSTIGLAPAIFGPLMNISGSSLATWWHGKLPPEDVKNEPKEATALT
ncbi:bile acid:sodium symporter family protein [Mucilaginibacter paludis]|uniref:Bile acid:sodium symporter n=1 Tax=Mucilaginibacter paludis DSM 18603 TaxID=714943 RepID=H1YET7_9SPHI|nr:bile acid:sodium symporter family protein [Mucilaginibacter paludis]EHQ24354.1 Bile acid:sodium symporter [Mucilaginibacter paludis DSM 18603]